MKKTFLFAIILLITPVIGLGIETQPIGTGAQLPKGHPVIHENDANPAPPLTGKVLKTMDSGGYTYIYLQRSKGRKAWVAIPKKKVTVGQIIALVPGEELKNFKSQTLNRTFDKIIFSLGPIAPGEPENSANPLPAPGNKYRVVAAENIIIEKASGPEAYTVAEIFTQKKKLAGKQVVVRGKIVKIVPRIMKMNWLHIQDGTVSMPRKSHDLVVRTKTLPATGEIVTVKGTLLSDKDFGSGYRYEVLLDNAEIVN